MHQNKTNWAFQLFFRKQSKSKEILSILDIVCFTNEQYEDTLQQPYVLT